MRKKQIKIQVIVYKAKDGFRWHFKRNGRIIAESGEAYTRIGSIKKILVNLFNSIEVQQYDLHYPAKA